MSSNRAEKIFDNIARHSVAGTVLSQIRPSPDNFQNNKAAMLAAVLKEAPGNNEGGYSSYQPHQQEIAAVQYFVRDPGDGMVEDDEQVLRFNNSRFQGRIEDVVAFEDEFQYQTLLILAALHHYDCDDLPDELSVETIFGMLPFMKEQIESTAQKWDREISENANHESYLDQVEELTGERPSLSENKANVVHPNSKVPPYSNDDFQGVPSGQAIFDRLLGCT